MIGKLGRQVSRLGFGAFRVNNETHAEALRKALVSGVNIIDTAANFENVSKSGYLLPNEIENLDGSKDYVQVRDKSYHSISPRVLEMQITQSLERLNTDKLDIYMINAPERMLMAQSRSYSASQLYKDIAAAFQHLDTEVANGRIRGYGVCSNTLADPTAVDHVSLPSVINACAKHDNLVAIETPFNFFERKAIVQPHGLTVADICEKHNLFLLTNRPLTAIHQGQVQPLVNRTFGDGSSQAEHAVMEQMSQSLEVLTNMESDLMSELPLEQETLTAKFIWAQVISDNLSNLSNNHFAAKHFLEKMLLSSLGADLKALLTYAEKLDDPEALPVFQQWAADYQKVRDLNIEELSQHLIDYAYIDCLRKNNDLDRIISAVCPRLTEPEKTYSPISVKMLRIALANKQIGTVLTGMRNPLYVDDAKKALAWHNQQPLDATDLDDLWRVPLY
ncbi:hypothetical protein NQZ79_g6397 [Umbelopsis isabellina]|nr:hypothetical protein NQZ79_g6397 [Umbelopsis isabellina]